MSASRHTSAAQFGMSLPVYYQESGVTGNNTHITEERRGEIPTSEIATMPGACGEVPGEHGKRVHGHQWSEFRNDIKENGIKEPVFVMVRHGETRDQIRLAEGNHRRDAAVELGLPTVPIQVRYFGHAERS